MRSKTKISVIGAGFVGSATAFALLQAGASAELVIVDANRAKAEGEVMDLSHAAAVVPATRIYTGGYEATKDSDIVIITAGAGQKPGETRLDLVNKNVAIMKSIIPEVVKYSPDSLLLIVSNPVDILSYVAYKLSGFPAHRVIGSGTVLDSSRLCYVLGRELGLDARDIHAYILGEHGDHEFASWSSIKIGSVDLKDHCWAKEIDYLDLKERACTEVKRAAYDIIDRKGYTNYAVALAVRRIVEAIMRDERAILSISTFDERNDLYYAIPAIVGYEGAMDRFPPSLDKEEKEKLDLSIKVLKDVIADIEW